MLALASQRSSPCASWKQVAERGGSGEDWEDPVKLLKQEGMMVQARGKPDGRLPAVCAKPLQLHRDGGASQVLVARRLESLLKLWARLVKTQAGA